MGKSWCYIQTCSVARAILIYQLSPHTTVKSLVYFVHGKFSSSENFTRDERNQKQVFFQLDLCPPPSWNLVHQVSLSSQLSHGLYKTIILQLINILIFRVEVTVSYYLKNETIFNFYQCLKNSTKNKYAQRLHKSIIICSSKVLFSRRFQSKIIHSVYFSGLFSLLKSGKLLQIFFHFSDLGMFYNYRTFILQNILI